jgi:hypothetical protein
MLFVGITSFQSIHEWVHHHNEHSEHQDTSCDWYVIKALPFQKSVPATIEFLSAITTSAPVGFYFEGGEFSVNIYGLSDRGPPHSI